MGVAEVFPPWISRLGKMLGLHSVNKRGRAVLPKSFQKFSLRVRFFEKSLTYEVFDLSCLSCMLILKCFKMFKNVLLLLVLFSVVAEPTLFWVGVGCRVVWLRLLLFSH